MSLLATSCATPLTQTLGGERRPSVSQVSFCHAYRPVKYHTNDTDETIRQILVLNELYVETCDK